MPLTRVKDVKALGAYRGHRPAVSGWFTMATNDPNSAGYKRHDGRTSDSVFDAFFIKPYKPEDIASWIRHRHSSTGCADSGFQ
jgi:hypothetical protein